MFAMIKMQQVDPALEKGSTRCNESRILKQCNSHSRDQQTKFGGRELRPHCLKRLIFTSRCVQLLPRSGCNQPNLIASRELWSIRSSGVHLRGRRMVVVTSALLPLRHAASDAPAMFLVVVSTY